ncbi:hypothetical protein W02_01830 [Nitrospira sp. KM1]|uniref:hypothetical protein n=1 Tax=Nitrospira sp. KM1 TaxID=1936990 RepID=UPI0013A77B38|nr:hypothetical protein [Nitrospira sp. KM1]BCA53043.1 hypothetical protein W02_01830 [Nitrospira sp. KM1]
MPTAWIVRASLVAGSLLAVLIVSNDGWAKPKKGSTYWACKCACRYVDSTGKEHFGPSGAVQFTESSLEACLGHACTTGGHSGTTRDCTGTEHTQAINVPPGSLQQLQPQTTTPGRMPAPASGTIQRRGVEGEQSDAGMANPSDTAPETK